MKISNILRLYTSNAQGVFFGTFNEKKTRGLGVPFGAYALPVTMTIGAAMKTAVDVCTRKPLSKTTMQTVMDQLANMNIKSLNTLIQKLTTYTGQSNASRLFIEQLGQAKANLGPRQTAATQQNTSDVADVRAAKRLQAAEKQLAASGLALAGVRYELIADRTLEKDDKELLESMNPESQKTLLATYLQEQRTLIAAFLSDSKNSGKKTQQLIANHFTTFSEEKKVSSDEDDLDTSSLSSHTMS